MMGIGESKRSGNTLATTYVYHLLSWSHGMVQFLKERFQDCSDDFVMFVCKKCGRAAVVNVDAGVSRCNHCSNTVAFARLRLPFAMRLFCLEVQAIGLAVRLDTRRCSTSVGGGGSGVVALSFWTERSSVAFKAFRLRLRLFLCAVAVEDRPREEWPYTEGGSLTKCSEFRMMFSSFSIAIKSASLFLCSAALMETCPPPDHHHLSTTLVVGCRRREALRGYLVRLSDGVFHHLHAGNDALLHLEVQSESAARRRGSSPTPAAADAA
jgi:RNA polymerase Rpb2, domain 7